jgi:serine/threonine protein kinase
LLKENNTNSGGEKKSFTGELPSFLRNSAIHRKYSLTSVIAEDFAGTLYATGKKAGGKAVAVKVLKKGYALISNTLGNIEHSRICQVLHTIIEHDKIQAVVFEKPVGIPLSQMIQKSGTLSPGQTVSAALQLLSAIHAVHWNDAYVGNLHSDSIFLSRDAQGNLELQLINLGIGCIQDKLRETDYLAPEQIMGGKGGGPGSDIWAVGAIMYEMLFGSRPFKGENRYAVAGEILLQELNFSEKPKNVPDDLIVFIQKALEKDESRRYADVAQMVAELMPFQSEFNEPMSMSTKSAIRDSMPPSISQRESQVAKTAAKTSATTPKARVIPTVRISHTPSAPPSGIVGSRESGFGRSGKQTKLGMPAISLPAKRIPLKHKEDTGKFSAVKPSGLSSSSQRSGLPRKAAGEFPIPKEIASATAGKPATSSGLSVVTKTYTGIKSSLAGASAWIAGGVPKLLANSPKPSELKAGFLSLSTNLKALVLGSGALFLTLLTLLIVVIVGRQGVHAEEESAASLSKRDTQAITVYHGQLATVSPSQTAAADDAASSSTASIAIPKGKKVTIFIEGDLPNRAQVKVDDNPAKLPIVIDASRTPVSITITARGYAPFSQTITPIEDTTIQVEMEKLWKGRRGGNTGKPGGHRANKKSKTKKPAKTGDDLASNPFGG